MRPPIRLCLAALAAAALCPVVPARCETDTPRRVLERARELLRTDLRNLRKYTCTQTVDRRYFLRTDLASPISDCDDVLAAKNRGAARLELEAMDRLRLDVANADNGAEMYSWAGAGRIEWQNVAELVGGGTIGTGPLGPFLGNVFQDPGMSFDYLGARIVDGRAAFEYRFRVPKERSNYHLLYGSRPKIIGYDGTFWLDAVSAELRQLRVRTAELPKESGHCEAVTTVDFGRVRLGDREYLLPRRSLLNATGRYGDESETSTTYSACREYRGESEIRFGDEPAEQSVRAAAGAAKGGNGRLRAGLDFLLGLDSEIRFETGAAGDAVACTVLEDVMEKGARTRTVIVPAGAVVRGRIIRLERHVMPPRFLMVTVLLDTLEMQGGTVPFQAELMRLGTPRRHTVRLETVAGRPFGRGLLIWDPKDRIPPGEVSVRSHSAATRGGTFVFPGNSGLVVPRGFQSRWRTLD